MNKENNLNKKEKELVYLGASISSGCRPCTKYHLRKCSEAGLTEIEINKALALAISVRDLASRSMESLAYNQKKIENIEEEKTESLNRNDILVGIAAAYSVNFPSGLEKYLNIGRKSGISDKVLSEIIKLSNFVINKAKAHVDILADKIGIVKAAEKNKAEDSCCC